MKAIVVGCGAIASRWVRVLAADPRVAIVALVDPDLDRATRLGARHGLSVAVAPTVHAAVAATTADVVVNLPPPDAHPAVIRTALAAGLHVLTEKPLTLRLADAVELIEQARSAGRVLAVMRNRGQDPDFLTFAGKVTRDPVPLVVTAEVLVDLPEPGFRAGQALPATSDLAVHAFDQVQALITAPPEQVACREVPLPLLGGHCTLTTITVTYADGSVFAYRGGYAGRGLRTPATGLWRVDGPDRAARWDGQAPADGPAGTPAYQRCITDMLDAVHTGTVGPWPTAVLRSVAMLDAALTSATTGVPVAVPPLPQDPR